MIPGWDIVGAASPEHSGAVRGRAACGDAVRLCHRNRTSPVKPTNGSIADTLNASRVDYKGIMFGRKPPIAPAARTCPPSLLNEASLHPGGWVYEIRPGVDPLGAVAPEDIVGAWAVDSDGAPTGEFTPNPRYRQDER